MTFQDIEHQPQHSPRKDQGAQASPYAFVGLYDYPVDCMYTTARVKRNPKKLALQSGIHFKYIRMIELLQYLSPSPLLTCISVLIIVGCLYHHLFAPKLASLDVPSFDGRIGPYGKEFYSAIEEGTSEVDGPQRL